MENYQAAPLHGLRVRCLLPARAGALGTLQHRGGPGAQSACQHVWCCPEQHCHGEPPAATRAGEQGPKLAAVDGARELASLGTRKLPGSWAPSHCSRASTRQTSCPSRMSAQPAHVTFPIWDEAAGNPRQPRTGPEPSPAVTCTQKVQRAQSWAQADPVSSGSTAPQRTPSCPSTAASAAPAGTAAPARASRRVTRKN